MNPIIVPCRNNLALTKKAVKTFKEQDIDDVHIFIINNGSTDGTNQWLTAQRDIIHMYMDPPASVAKSWNTALQAVFLAGAEYALVVNNDVELRPDTYRLLVEDGGGFVTAVGNRDPTCVEPIGQMAELLRGGEYRKGQVMVLPSGVVDVYADVDPEKKRPHPDFSCFLIRKDAYESVGPFDENFLIAFGEDWDYHIRLHNAGITAYCIDLPFLHHGSMTVKNADMSEVRKIHAQAEKNRAYFKQKWGMAGASKEYYDFFGKQQPKDDE